MQRQREVSQEQARALAEIARLDLSPDRLATLTSSLSEYLAMVEQLRAIDPGDREPPVITCDGEAKT